MKVSPCPGWFSHQKYEIRSRRQKQKGCSLCLVENRFQSSRPRHIRIAGGKPAVFLSQGFQPARTRWRNCETSASRLPAFSESAFAEVSNCSEAVAVWLEASRT